jgi:hypothetical protein
VDTTTFIFLSSNKAMRQCSNPRKLVHLLGLSVALFCTTDAFSVTSRTCSLKSVLKASTDSNLSPVNSIEAASRILADWDKFYNPDTGGSAPPDTNDKRRVIPEAVLLLSTAAAAERSQDSTKGRCMLGICASSPEEGIATLKSWVTTLQLQRGLIHGMDKDGVPLEIEGGVYIKYNSGGVYSFSAIRKSGLGFDALWKPGDCLLESYDGTYRGVYFQVELADGEFRQYLVPSDTFTLDA